MLTSYLSTFLENTYLHERTWINSKPDQSSDSKAIDKAYLPVVVFASEVIESMLVNKQVMSMLGPHDENNVYAILSQQILVCSSYVIRRLELLVCGYTHC